MINFHSEKIHPKGLRTLVNHFMKVLKLIRLLKLNIPPDTYKLPTEVILFKNYIFGVKDFASSPQD